MTDKHPDEQRQISLRLEASCTFAGGLAVGLGVNAVSDTYPGAFAPAVGGAVFLVALAAAKLRRLPPQAPIHRLVSRATLMGAAVAALVSLIAPPGWRPWAVLAATTLALTSCLTPPSEHVGKQLSSLAMVAFGVAMIGLGAAWLLHYQVLPGMVMIVLGVATIPFGVALVGLGVGWLLESRLVTGMAQLSAGVIVISLGVALLIGQLMVPAQLMVGTQFMVVAGMTMVALGVLMIGGAVSTLLNSDQLLGAMAIGGGVLLIGLGVPALVDSELLLGVALIGGGGLIIALAVAMLLESQLLKVVVMIAFGILSIGLSVVLIGLGVRLTALGVGWMLDSRFCLSCR
jgi:hypothetical protein